MKKIYLILLFILSFNIFAQKVPGIKFYTYMYQVQKGDTFDSILAHFIRPDIFVRLRSKMVKETMKRNPQIINWDQLTPNKPIVLFLSPTLIDWNKLSRGVTHSLHRYPPIPRKPVDKRIHLGGFYSFSFGTFNEITTDILTKSSTAQNSPYTLGLNFNKNVNREDNLNGSIYYSSINNVVYSSSEIFPLPSEFGLTAYYQTTVFKNVHPYIGLDYENFSVFDAQEYQNFSQALVKTLSLSFITIGISKPFTLFKRSFFSKFSFSRSFLNSSIQDLTSYNGEKLIVFIGTVMPNGFSVTAFYKKHFLKGETILNIGRYGFGFGYRFF